MSEKYRTDWILFKELGQMTKPSFQRGFKWSQKKQNELIETIRNGLPFGMFLLDEKSKGNYNILDGQQRYTTIRNYKNDMSAFISNEDIKSDDLIKELSSIDDIKSAVKKCKTKLEKVNYKFIFKDCKCDVKKSMKAIRAEINEILTAEIDLKEKTRNKIEDCIENWINATLKRIDVDNIKIPVIILTNAIEDKADVFIKLNQTGLKLNKYELLAAQWNDKDSKLCCKDRDIIKAVLDRYKNVNDKEIEFDEFDEDDIKNSENGHKNITAFEYLYGLSKIIDKKIESILNNKKTDESAYGFIIVSEIFDKAFKDIDDLNKKLVKYSFIEDLNRKIIESVSAIFEKLKNEFEAPDERVYLDHTEFQIVSYIVTYFKTKYEFDDDGKILAKKNAADKRNLKNLIDYLPQHYIYDNLIDFWSGSGDNKLHDLVKNKSLNNNKYYQFIDETEIRTQLKKWFNDKNNDTKFTVKPDTKMILSYLLNKTAADLKELKKKDLQWEHIGIKAKLDDFHIYEGISSPANITLIPPLDNIKKKKLTYYEYDKEMAQGSLYKFSDVDLSKLLYPKHAEIKWVEGTKDINEAEFQTFKDNRTNMLIDKITESLSENN